MTSIEAHVQQPYKYGFVTDIESEVVPAGLNEDVIRLISAKKGEPEWMLDWRLKAYRNWLKMSEPHWPNVKYGPIDYQAISYYAAPKKLPKLDSLDQVDPKLVATFEKLGIPIEEQKRLTGVAVDAVFDSVSVATTFQAELAKFGVIFCPISQAIREHPELVQKYLGTVVPHNDNYFAALNTAVFTDGSFVYVPKGVRCPLELSTYFRINASSTGQFERTLIIADEGSYVSYLEAARRRCGTRISSTPQSSSSSRSSGRRSSIRRSRTGTRATKRVRAGSTTSSRSAASVPVRTPRSRGRRSRPDRRSRGSIQAASSRATTRSASSIRWRSPVTSNRPTPVPR